MKLFYSSQINLFFWREHIWFKYYTNIDNCLDVTLLVNGHLRVAGPCNCTHTPFCVFPLPPHYFVACVGDGHVVLENPLLDNGSVLPSDRQGRLILHQEVSWDTTQEGESGFIVSKVSKINSKKYSKKYSKKCSTENYSKKCSKKCSKKYSKQCSN